MTKKKKMKIAKYIPCIILCLYMSIYLSMCVYVYVCMSMYVCVCVDSSIYMHTYMMCDICVFRMFYIRYVMMRR